MAVAPKDGILTRCFLIAARSFTQMGKQNGRTPGNVRVRVEARERAGRGGGLWEELTHNGWHMVPRILVGTKATPNGRIRQLVGALSD